MAAEVRGVRDALGVTQRELAGLLGVSTMTISHWECARLSPSGYQCALLAAFSAAAETQPNVGRLAAAEIEKRGVPAALYLILAAAYV